MFKFNDDDYTNSFSDIDEFLKEQVENTNRIEERQINRIASGRDDVIYDRKEPFMELERNRPSSKSIYNLTTSLTSELDKVGYGYTLRKGAHNNEYELLWYPKNANLEKVYAAELQGTDLTNKKKVWEVLSKELPKITISSLDEDGTWSINGQKFTNPRRDRYDFANERLYAENVMQTYVGDIVDYVVDMGKKTNNSNAMKMARESESIKDLRKYIAQQRRGVSAVGEKALAGPQATSNFQGLSEEYRNAHQGAGSKASLAIRNGYRDVDRLISDLIDHNKGLIGKYNYNFEKNNGYRKGQDEARQALADDLFSVIPYYLNNLSMTDSRTAANVNFFSKERAYLKDSDELKIMIQYAEFLKSIGASIDTSQESSFNHHMVTTVRNKDLLLMGPVDDTSSRKVLQAAMTAKKTNKAKNAVREELSKKDGYITGKKLFTKAEVENGLADEDDIENNALYASRMITMDDWITIRERAAKRIAQDEIDKQNEILKKKKKGKKALTPAEKIEIRRQTREDIIKSTQAYEGGMLFDEKIAGGLESELERTASGVTVKDLQEEYARQSKKAAKDKDGNLANPRQVAANVIKTVIAKEKGLGSERNVFLGDTEDAVADFRDIFGDYDKNLEVLGVSAEDSDDAFLTAFAKVMTSQDKNIKEQKLSMQFKELKELKDAQKVVSRIDPSMKGSASVTDSRIFDEAHKWLTEEQIKDYNSKYGTNINPTDEKSELYQKLMARNKNVTMLRNVEEISPRKLAEIYNGYLMGVYDRVSSVEGNAGVAKFLTSLGYDLDDDSRKALENSSTGRSFLEKDLLGRSAKELETLIKGANSYMSTSDNKDEYFNIANAFTYGDDGSLKFNAKNYEALTDFQISGINGYGEGNGEAVLNSDYRLQEAFYRNTMNNSRLSEAEKQARIKHFLGDVEYSDDEDSPFGKTLQVRKGGQRGVLTGGDDKEYQDARKKYEENQKDFMERVKKNQNPGDMDIFGFDEEAIDEISKYGSYDEYGEKLKEENKGKKGKTRKEDLRARTSNRIVSYGSFEEFIGSKDKIGSGNALFEAYLAKKLGTREEAADKVKYDKDYAALKERYAKALKGNYVDSSVNDFGEETKGIRKIDSNGKTVYQKFKNGEWVNIKGKDLDDLDYNHKLQSLEARGGNKETMYVGPTGTSGFSHTDNGKDSVVALGAINMQSQYETMTKDEWKARGEGYQPNDNAVMTLYSDLRTADRDFAKKKEQYAEGSEELKRAEVEHSKAVNAAYAKAYDEYNNKEGTQYKKIKSSKINNSAFVSPMSPDIDENIFSNYFDESKEKNANEKKDILNSLMNTSMVISSRVGTSKDTEMKAAYDLLDNQAGLSQEDYIAALERNYKYLYGNLENDNVIKKNLESLRKGKGGKQLSDNEYVDNLKKTIINSATLGTDEYRKRLDKAAALRKQGRNVRLRGLAATGLRYPLSNAYDDQSADLFFDKKLDEGSAIFGLGLSRRFNGDWDGDKYGFYLSLMGGKKGDEKDEEALLSAETKERERVADINEAVALEEKAAYSGAASKKGKANKYESEISAKDLNSLFDENAQGVGADLSRLGKNKVGLLSNNYQAVAEAMTRNMNNHNSEQKAAAVLTNAFFEAMTQDAISAKKVTQRIAAKSGFGEDINGFAKSRKKKGLTLQDFEEYKLYENEVDQLMERFKDQNTYRSKDTIKSALNAAQQTGIFGNGKDKSFFSGRITAEALRTIQDLYTDSNGVVDREKYARALGIDAKDVDKYLYRKDKNGKLVRGIEKTDENGNITYEAGAITEDMVANAMFEANQLLEARGTGIGSAQMFKKEFLPGNKSAVTNPFSTIGRKVNSYSKEELDKMYKDTPELAALIEAEQKANDESLPGSLGGGGSNASLEGQRVDSLNKEAEALRTVIKESSNFSKILQGFARQNGISTFNAKKGGEEVFEGIEEGQYYDRVSTWLNDTFGGFKNKWDMNEFDNYISKIYDSDEGKAWHDLNNVYGGAGKTQKDILAGLNKDLSSRWRVQNGKIADSTHQALTDAFTLTRGQFSGDYETIRKFVTGEEDNAILRSHETTVGNALEDALFQGGSVGAKGDRGGEGVEFLRGKMSTEEYMKHAKKVIDRQIKEAKDNYEKGKGQNYLQFNFGNEQAKIDFIKGEELDQSQIENLYRLQEAAYEKNRKLRRILNSPKFNKNKVFNLGMGSYGGGEDEEAPQITNALYGGEGFFESQKEYIRGKLLASGMDESEITDEEIAKHIIGTETNHLIKTPGGEFLNGRSDLIISTPGKRTIKAGPAGASESQTQDIFLLDKKFPGHVSGRYVIQQQLYARGIQELVDSIDKEQMNLFNDQEDIIDENGKVIKGKTGYELFNEALLNTKYGKAYLKMFGKDAASSMKVSKELYTVLNTAHGKKDNIRVSTGTMLNEHGTTKVYENVLDKEHQQEAEEIMKGAIDGTDFAGQQRLDQFDKDVDASKMNVLASNYYRPSYYDQAAGVIYQSKYHMDEYQKYIKEYNANEKLLKKAIKEGDADNVEELQISKKLLAEKVGEHQGYLQNNLGTFFELEKNGSIKHRLNKDTGEWEYVTKDITKNFTNDQMKVAEAYAREYSTAHGDIVAKIGEKNFLTDDNENNGIKGKISGVAKEMGGLVKALPTLVSLRRLAQTFRKVWQEAKQLDSALTNLRIVTGDSREATVDTITKYSDLASTLGRTTTEVASSAIEWQRQGYSASETIDLVTSSMYLSTLGMLDASTATKDLTSALKGFKISATDSMDVVDKLTALDMKAATSAGEIANGLSQFANLGSSMGVDIDEASAYVATISDVTQMSGASAGQALKTIISRYGNVKATAYGNIVASSDTSEGTNEVNDVEKVLKNLNINIRSSALKFKDFDDVLDEIAEKWESLDSVSKRAVGTAFAGTRQQEAFTTLMENWDKYKDLYEVSKNSKGTAEEKYQSYEESYQAAVNSAKAEWEKIVNDSEIVTIGTNIFNVVTQILKYVGPIFEKMWPTILTWVFQKQINGGIDQLKERAGILKSKFEENSDKVAANTINTAANNVVQALMDNTAAIKGETTEESNGKNIVKDNNVKENATAVNTNSNGNNSNTNASTNNEAQKVSEKSEKNSEKTGTPKKDENKNSDGENSKTDKKTLNQYVTKKNKGNKGKNKNKKPTKSADSDNNNKTETTSTDSNSDNTNNTNKNNINSLNKKEKKEADSSTNTKPVKDDTGAGGSGDKPTEPTGGNEPKPTDETVNNAKNGLSLFKKGGPSIAALINTASSFVTGAETHRAEGAFGTNISTASSDDAQFAGRMTKGAASSLGLIIGTAIGGPAGSMIGSSLGSVVGETVGDLLASAIDKERDDANKATEEANARLKTIKSIQSTTEDLSDYVTDIDFDDNLEAIKDSVRTIKENLLENDEYEKYNEILKSGTNGESYTDASGNEYKNIYEVLSDMESEDLKTRERALDVFESISAGEEAIETQQTYESENYEAAKSIKDSVEELNTGSDYDLENTLNYIKTQINNLINNVVEIGKTVLNWFNKTFNSNEQGNFSYTDFSKDLIEKYGLLTTEEVNKLDFDNLTKDELEAYADKYEEASEKLSEEMASGDFNEYDVETLKAVKEDIDSIASQFNTLASNYESQRKEYGENLAKQAYYNDTNGLKDDSISKIRQTMENSNKGIKEIYDYIFNEYFGGEDSEAVKALKNAGIAVYDEDGNYSSEMLTELKKIVKLDDEVSSALTSQNLTLGKAYSLHTNSAGVAKSIYDKEVLENFATAIGTTFDDLEDHIGEYSMMTLSELQMNAAEVVQANSNYTSVLDSVTDGTKSYSEAMNTIITKYPDLIQYMNDEDNLIDAIVKKGKQYATLELEKQRQELNATTQFFDVASEEWESWAEKNGATDLYQKVVIDSGATTVDAVNNYLSEILKNKEETGVYKDSKGNIYSDEDIQDLVNMLSSYDTTLTSDTFEEEEKNYINYRTQLMDAQINNLTKQRDMLKEITNQREYENKLIEAKLKLENAMNDKKRVYRAGVGFVYEADQSAIKEAKDNLEEVQVDKQVSAIQKQIDQLQGEKDDWSNIWTKKTYEKTEERAIAFEKEYMDNDASALNVYSNLTEQEIQQAKDVGEIEATLGENSVGADALTQISSLAETGWQTSYSDSTKNYWDTQISSILSTIAANGYSNGGVVDGSGGSSSSSDSSDGTSGSGNTGFNSPIDYEETDTFTKIRNALSTLTGDKKITAYSDIHDINGGIGKYSITGNYQTDLKNYLQTIAGISYNDVQQLTKSQLDEITIETDSYLSSLYSEINTFKKDTSILKSIYGSDYGSIIKKKSLNTIASLYENILGCGSNLGTINATLDTLDQFHTVITQKNLGSLQSEAKQFLSNYYDGLYDAAFGEEAGRSYLENYFASGILSTYGDGLSMINELGTEAIVTPNGTITSLPSHTGIIPADITKNLWSLGEIAPNILRAVETYSDTISGTSNGGQNITNDDSFNISNLTMNVDASGDFDVDEFVTSIKNRVALSKNSH